MIGRSKGALQVLWGLKHTISYTALKRNQNTSRTYNPINQPPFFSGQILSLISTDRKPIKGLLLDVAKGDYCEDSLKTY